MACHAAPESAGWWGIIVVASVLGGVSALPGLGYRCGALVIRVIRVIGGGELGGVPERFFILIVGAGRLDGAPGSLPVGPAAGSAVRHPARSVMRGVPSPL
ncbi:MAG TPA: hypothetical protein VL179_00915 [Mycobacterium sp.]|nr:hypothetical protein [Mycobacterium sp.]